MGDSRRISGRSGPVHEVPILPIFCRKRFTEFRGQSFEGFERLGLLSPVLASRVCKHLSVDTQI